jgi:hypothetical protein
MMKKVSSALLALLLLLSLTLTGTFAWSDFTQRKTNEMGGTIDAYNVQLVKRGMDTATPLANTYFDLYSRKDGREEKLDGVYVTDQFGAIELGGLPAGDYLFREVNPPYGYNLDLDTRNHPFTLSEDTVDEHQYVYVAAVNSRRYGDLTVRKTVVNADGSPLTDEQKEQLFTFTIVIEGDGVQELGDGGFGWSLDGVDQPANLPNTATIQLKHGQQAVIRHIPAGAHYTVTETPAADTIVTGENHSGTLPEGGAQASFINTYGREPEPGTLTVKKQVTGEGADPTRKFDMTVTIDGVPHRIALAGGEVAVFADLPAGAYYEVKEDDLYGTGYIQGGLTDGFGTIDGDKTALVTNTFVGTVITEIRGQKTWEHGDNPEASRPAHIVVQLKCGEAVMAQKTVTAADGWSYAFNAPKYDAEANEVAYSIAELPVPNYAATVDGYNLHNTYVPPAVTTTSGTGSAASSTDSTTTTTNTATSSTVSTTTDPNETTTSDPSTNTSGSSATTTGSSATTSTDSSTTSTGSSTNTAGSSATTSTDSSTTSTGSSATTTGSSATTSTDPDGTTTTNDFNFTITLHPTRPTDPDSFPVGGGTAGGPDGSGNDGGANGQNPPKTGDTFFDPACLIHPALLILIILLGGYTVIRLVINRRKAEDIQLQTIPTEEDNEQ